MDQLIPKDVTKALKLIEREVMRVPQKRHPMNGAHAGYAYILEDVDGLWASVKAKPRSWWQLRADAVQIAATAVQFILSVTDVDDEAMLKALRDAGLPADGGD